MVAKQVGASRKHEGERDQGKSKTYSGEKLPGYSLFLSRLRPLPLLPAFVAETISRLKPGWTARVCGFGRGCWKNGAASPGLTKNSLPCPGWPLVTPIR